MIPALIYGGASLLSGLISGIGAKRNTDATNASAERAAEIYNQGQMDLAKYQNDYNLEMWKMQNEYNSAAAQMQRYRDAGLNPNLIYGNGASSAGNAASAPEAAKADFMAPNYGRQDNGWNTAAQAFLQAEGLFSQIGLQKSQADFNEAKIMETIAATEQRAQQTELTKLQQLSQIIHNETDQGTKKALIDYYFLRNDSLNQSMDKTRQDIEESKSRIALNRSNTEVNTERKLEIKARTGLSIAQTNAVYSQIQKTAHEIAEIDSRRSLNNQQFQYNQETWADRADQISAALANSVQQNRRGEIEIDRARFEYEFERMAGYKPGASILSAIAGPLGVGLGNLSGAFTK